MNVTASKKFEQTQIDLIEFSIIKSEVEFALDNVKDSMLNYCDKKDAEFLLENKRFFDLVIDFAKSEIVESFEECLTKDDYKIHLMRNRHMQKNAN
jgi:hypothetical protein